VRLPHPEKVKGAFMKENRNHAFLFCIGILLLCSAAFLPSCQKSAPKIKGLSKIPVDKKANEDVKRLKAYLTDNFGKVMLSGQQDLTWEDSVDMLARVEADTGKLPAIAGFDFMQYTMVDTKGAEGLNQVEEAIAWHKKGGIVCFCWHWRDPMKSTIEFNTDMTKFRINMDKKSYAYKAMVKDIAIIAKQLKRLEDAGVPVLFRPLHEAGGGWFWWGARTEDNTSAEKFIALYRLLVEQINVVHGIHNVLWVCNGQNPGWYAGDKYVDIIGEDIYASNPPDHSPYVARYNQAAAQPENELKILAMTENGSMPDPDALLDEGFLWSYFMTWNDGVGNLHAKQKDNFWTGEYWNEDSFKKYVYNHEKVITLDELPDLDSYPYK
jgi:mannan endo-1,4-beta-mannosidase